MPAKLPETEGRRHAMGFRTTLEGKNRLEEAARLSGRSVSQEIEARLEHTFMLDKIEDALKKNPIGKMIDGDTESMFRNMTTAVGAAMAYLNKSWKNDVFARMAFRAGVEAVMDTIFLKHPLNIEGSGIALADLKKAQETGTLYGRLLAASQDNPAVEGWLSQRAAELGATENSERDADAEKAKLLKYLVGTDAA
ncbi:MULTISPECIES: hypothetical protein [unclassified Methylobacterium]|uniref:hypothetical protein n=1 Tax=unclassified Methylobacterium TaxID=2615210 RepID=UPI001FBAEA8B|nr:MULTISPECIES: hypothetical protein [unclassified Methylobacterium]MCJ2093953.1 hypothetical protein [Methylobacterium sp. J-072]MCJ2142933.1 hypothetical protein [Methylobacterium sp. E-066]